MCLSSVYCMSNNKKVLLCKNIVEVTPLGDTWIFKDIMGRETTQKAVIEKINLTDGVIYIRNHEEG